MAKVKKSPSIESTMSHLTRHTNDRRYPNCKSPRPDKYKFRQEEAAERLAAWRALSTSDKIALLDRRLGAGIGATKQRSALQEQLQKELAAVTPSKPQLPVTPKTAVPNLDAVIADMNSTNKTQKVRAKDRRKNEQKRTAEELD
jgi:hypothetical protein